MIDAVTFTGCTATIYGGAIFISGGGTADVISSSFTGCSAASGGGAIAALPVALTITSSSFERCSAGTDGGGAILSFATTNVHFSRFYQNIATGSGTTMRFVSGTIDANNNWWGTNSGPGTSFFGPSAAVASWLVLGITADPSSITLPQTSYIRTNLTYNSDGTNTAGGGIYLPGCHSERIRCRIRSRYCRPRICRFSKRWCTDDLRYPPVRHDHDCRDR